MNKLVISLLFVTGVTSAQVTSIPGASGTGTANINVLNNAGTTVVSAISALKFANSATVTCTPTDGGGGMAVITCANAVSVLDASNAVAGITNKSFADLSIDADKPLLQYYVNDTSTGTTANRLVKFATGNKVVDAGASTTGLFGVVYDGAGTTGSARVATKGVVQCYFSGATTAGQYAVAAGASSQCSSTASPTAGVQVLGDVLETIGGAGLAKVNLRAMNIQPGTGAGDASTNTATSVDSEIALFSGTGGKTLKRATTTGVLKATSGVIAAATDGTDITSGAKAQSGSQLYCADGGANDTYTCTMTPTLTAYTTGMRVMFKPNTANTGAASLNIDSLGAKNIKTINGNDPADNTLLAGKFYDLIYDGTNLQLATPVLIAQGTAALGTSAITSTNCASVVTVSATGVATTDVIQWTPNADITAVTGYTPATTGGLSIYPYPTSGNVNFKVCNPTSSSITPGAVTLNWRVVR